MRPIKKIQGIVLLAACLTVAAAVSAMPSPDDKGRQVRNLVLEAIEFNGLESVSTEDAGRALGLTLDEALDQDHILSAIERLEASRLFETVRFFTRPGSVRGRIVLVLDVTEPSPRSTDSDVLVGTGIGDVDGWYAIPFQFRLLNLAERDDVLSFRFVLGYRLTGLEMNYRNQGLLGGRGWWGARAKTLAAQRIYFDGGVEVAHMVDRSSFSLISGRSFGRHWNVLIEAGRENVDPSNEAVVYRANETLDVDVGDVISFDELPSGVRASVGEAHHGVLEATLNFDSLDDDRIVDTARGGFWGQLQLRSTSSRDGDYAQVGLDLRTSQAVGNNALAVRAKGVVVEDNAPFYDRQYLGGLYTVRGFPSQSLTPPAGSTWLWSTSIELRTPLIGDPVKPRLAGLLFVDVGDAENRIVGSEAVAAGAGWGLRWRLFGVILGADFAVPITATPVDEAFHGNVSIGWSF